MFQNCITFCSIHLEYIKSYKKQVHKMCLHKPQRLFKKFSSKAFCHFFIMFQIHRNTWKALLCPFFPITVGECFWYLYNIGSLFFPKLSKKLFWRQYVSNYLYCKTWLWWSIAKQKDDRRKKFIPQWLGYFSSSIKQPVLILRIPRQYHYTGRLLFWPWLMRVGNR